MNTTRAIHFYDAATPENVPSGVYAAVYVNGFVWPQAQVRRMAKVIRISIRREAFWAEHARCLDIELGAAEPGDAVPFVRRRRAFLKAHGLHGDDATCYVNRSNIVEVRQLFEEAHEPPPLVWVATLDGTTEVEGAWAVQYETTGRFDLSILHGVDNFRRP